jgi:hypothetical protein
LSYIEIKIAMAEISDIQVLCVVLIIALYFLVFMTISNNWSYKVKQYKEKLESDKILAELITTLDNEVLTKTYAREIKLVPDLKEKRVATLHEHPVRTLDFSNVQEQEKELLREAK